MARGELARDAVDRRRRRASDRATRGSRARAHHDARTRGRWVVIRRCVRGRARDQCRAAPRRPRP
eukprot:29192-Pelagococcus_subviridis.AAC.3